MLQNSLTLRRMAAWWSDLKGERVLRYRRSSQLQCRSSLWPYRPCLWHWLWTWRVSIQTISWKLLLPAGAHWCLNCKRVFCMKSKQTFVHENPSDKYINALFQVPLMRVFFSIETDDDVVNSDSDVSVVMWLRVNHVLHEGHAEQ